MSEKIQVGPQDDKKLPHQSMGELFYNEIRRKDPDTVIMADEGSGDEVTYGQLLDLSVKLATGLKNLGVKKGDVITIVSQNQWRYIVTIIAGFYTGATVNLFNPDYTREELKHFLCISQPLVIFCTSKSLGNILKLDKETFFPKNLVIYADEPCDQAVNFGSILMDPDVEFKIEEVDSRQDVALILTSSGTTGLPKCVMLTHANLRVTLSYCGDPVVLDLNPTQRELVYLPFFHSFGTTTILGSIYYGAKLVILDRFVPDNFLRIIQEHQITSLGVVPPVLLFLAKSPLVDKYDLSSIQDVVCAAAFVRKDLEEMVEKRLNLKIRQAYGMTEVSSVATILLKDSKRHGSVGKPVATFKIKVCDVDTGETLPAYQVGELRLFGDGVMKGYLGDEEQTRSAFDEEGFLKSGDLGYYDDEGFFYIVDRLKEIIKYKAFQVSPAELETLLLLHPAVKDAAVIGIPDERAGEVPLAFVVKQPNQTVTAEDVVQYVRENVSAQKQLRGGVRFVQEIPKNSTGKIVRRKLKDLL